MLGRGGGSSEFNPLGELIRNACGHLLFQLWNLRHLEIGVSHLTERRSMETAHTGWCLFIAWYHLPYASTLRADQSPSTLPTLPTLPTEGEGDAAREDPGD